MSMVGELVEAARQQATEETARRCAEVARSFTKRLAKGGAVEQEIANAILKSAGLEPESNEPKEVPVGSLCPACGKDKVVQDVMWPDQTCCPSCGSNWLWPKVLEPETKGTEDD